jgi:hypothetical protein
MQMDDDIYDYVYDAQLRKKYQRVVHNAQQKAKLIGLPWDDRLVPRDIRAFINNRHRGSE